jgi:hypothetical protein
MEGALSGEVIERSKGAYLSGAELFKGGEMLSRLVQLEVFRVYWGEDGPVVPMRWMPKGKLTGLGPEFDGNLELHRAGEESSRLALIGSYRPPLGAVGERLDQILLHRAAEATARAMIGRMAEMLLAQVELLGDEDMQVSGGGERPVPAR